MQSNINTKRKLFQGLFALVCATLTNLAFAAPPNTTYIGLDVGGSRSGIDTAKAFSELSIPGGSSFSEDDNAKLAGRIYGGMQFNDYIAAELGYTLFSSTGFHVTQPSSVTTAGSIKQQAVDLVLVGTVPLEYFDLYAKAGGVTLNNIAKFNDQHVNEWKYGFKFGVGINTEIDNVRLKLGWDRIQKTGVSRNINFVYVGAAYYFFNLG